MYPTREQALALLAEAEPHNPGPWATTVAPWPTAPKQLQPPAGWTRTKRLHWAFCTILAADSANGTWVMYPMGILI